MNKRLGSQVLPRELGDIGLDASLQYDPYEDVTQNEQLFTPFAEELVPMPEVSDQYKGAEILLPIEEHVARYYVVAWSHDANGNALCRAHANPSLDTRLYQTKFTAGKVTGLTTDDLSLNEEMIDRAPIVKLMSNLRMTQDMLDRAYFSYQCDIFKIDNALVYHILSNMLTDMYACVYMKQRRGIQDGQAVFFDIQKPFLGPDHVARQAPEAETKL